MSSLVEPPPPGCTELVTYTRPRSSYTTTRRQTKDDDIRYSARRLPSEDTAILDGLPVTTRERTIADLLDEPDADISLVADALRDAERSDSTPNAPTIPLKSADE
jgi:predicted transcriptional regulator of viral defense system